MVPARNPGAPEELGGSKARIAQQAQQGVPINAPKLQLRIDRAVRAQQELTPRKQAQANSLKLMLLRHHGEEGAALRAAEMTAAIFKALRSLGKYDVHDKNREMLRNRLMSKLQQLRNVLGELDHGQGTEPDAGGADVPGDAGADQAGKEENPLIRIVIGREEHTGAVDTGVVPERLAKHLSKEQLIGTAKAINALTDTEGFLLADSTGVGKTRQILATAQFMAERGKKVLIVSPASVIKPDWTTNEVGGSFVKRDEDGKIIGGDAVAMGIAVHLNRGDRQLRAGRRAQQHIR